MFLWGKGRYFWPLGADSPCVDQLLTNGNSTTPCSITLYQSRSLETRRTQSSSSLGVLNFSPGSAVGNLMHVQLLFLEGLVYQYESRTGRPLDSQTYEGRVHLAYTDPSKYNQVVKTISEESAYRYNKVRLKILIHCTS